MCSKELESLAKAVGELLQERSETLCTAESCSGGLLAHCITNIPGSSQYYLRGWVTYSNEAKSDDLGVPATMIAANGAVSNQVAGRMARGALKRAKAHYALAVTGIAGPGGGSEYKPVGLVYIALVGATTPLQVHKYIFTGNRLEVKEKTVRAALELLQATLLIDKPNGELTF